MPTHPLEAYLADCAVTRATGAATDETANYPVLKDLLDAAGKGLKPRVLCVMGLKDQGAGMPDGGRFTPDQFQKGEGTIRKGQLPSRGVVECKPPKADVLAIEKTEQITDYWERNNQVLVTNYREFLLIGRDDRGRPVRHERYRLAGSASCAWAGPEAASRGTSCTSTGPHGWRCSIGCDRLPTRDQTPWESGNLHPGRSMSC